LGIAIILHDIGVFYSQEPSHGLESAKRIQPHLDKLGLSLIGQGEVLSAVRAHDDKTHVDNSEQAVALRILDALEAFGEIGVFRFLEIYFRRGLRDKEGEDNIYRKALAGLEVKRENVVDSWFDTAELANIEAAHRRTREVFERELAEGPKILNAFIRIQWDVSRISEVLAKEEIAADEFATKYFTDLQAAFESFEPTV
ncbi:MAG: hypothetical protein ABH823_05375, partial [bacterium]